MSYGFQGEYVPLTKNEVLKRTSQEEIFKLVFGKYPELGKYYTNPLRNNDTTAGCFFEYHNGKLWFIDFGNDVTHNDCFNMVQGYFTLTFYESLIFINQELNLGLDNTGIVKPVIYDLPKVQSGLKHKTDIVYKSKPFSIADKGFWFDRYDIDKHELLEDNVFPILWYKLYSSKREDVITVRPNTLTYALAGFESARVKLYSPFANKKNKWISNCTADDVGGIDNLPLSGKQLIITKSYKDYRVLKNFGLNVVWFQNEGMIPNTSIIVNLCSRFDKIVVLFDNDNPGILASAKITATINSHFPNKAREISVPVNGTIKDPSDMYFALGRMEVLIFLIKSKLL